MDISDIISSYEKALDGRKWKGEALDILKEIVLPKAEVKIDGAIDYSKIRKLVDAKRIDSIVENLKGHLDSRGIVTNRQLVDFTKERKYLDFNSIRDVFCFHGVGGSAIKAVYTYMSDELKYCPFPGGYRAKELVERN